jgi:hypothetical protein
VREKDRFFDLVQTGKAAQRNPRIYNNKHRIISIPIEGIQFANGDWKQIKGIKN